MHDSFQPLAGLMPLWNLMLGCIVFGGVGAGLYGILMHVLMVVFIAGLMVGRTPEYLGKKIQAWEAAWAVIAILIPNSLILLGSAWACSTAPGLAGLGNNGPHGMSEIFYGYASCANNNGSAFAGLSANSLFYNLTLGATMFFGRFGVIFCVLAIAGSMAAKKIVPASTGTFPVNGLLGRAAGHDHDCGRADLLSRVVPRTHRGTWPDAAGTHFLNALNRGALKR